MIPFKLEECDEGSDDKETGDGLAGVLDNAKSLYRIGEALELIVPCVGPGLMPPPAACAAKRRFRSSRIASSEGPEDVSREPAVVLELAGKLA